MIQLERFAYSPMGTFGVLRYGDFSCFTVERPWINNQSRISCIPEGDYKLVWHNGPKFGKTVALVGGTVSQYPDGVAARSAILIHPANEMNDLQGCIGLGNGLGLIRNNWAVTSSLPAIHTFYKMLEENTNMLPSIQITQVEGTV